MKHIATVIADLDKKVKRLQKKYTAVGNEISETQAAILELQKIS